MITSTVDIMQSTPRNLEPLKSNYPVVLKVRTINNPGKGNCGFYAFAIGLIDLIQEERTYNCSVVFDRWIKLEPSVRECYKSICSYDFDKPNLKLLEALQRILRTITFNIQIEELKQACAAAKEEDEYQALVATSSYRKFAEMYYGVDLDSRFNELSKSPIIKKTIAKIDKSKVVEEHEALVLAPIFMSLIYGEGIIPGTITLTTKPSPNSPIINALRGITQNYVWATHLELDYLANAFEVNLHPLENGLARYPFQDIPYRHTITVNNQFNIHWTTQVTLAKAIRDSNPSVSVFSEKKGVLGNGKEAFELAKPLGKGSSKKLKSQQNKKPFFSPTDEIALQGLPPDSNQKKLDQLIRTVNRAVINYCGYSDSLWFSIFHRHGEAGRVRAIKLNRDLYHVEDYSEALKMVIRFLKDTKNGNTYNHSFRTMLLRELLTLNSKNKVDLSVISKKYDSALAHLIKQQQLPKTAERPSFTPK